MEFIIITVLFIATLVFLYFWQDKRDKVEENRFREFVIATKASDVPEYTTALPSLEEDDLPIPDEYQDVNEVDPDKLLAAIKNNENN